MNSINQNLNLVPVWQGLTNYRVGLELQDHFARKARESGAAYFLGFEHEPVITLGKRSHGPQATEKEIFLQAKQLEETGLDIVEIDRGGHATLHTPGQLVIYPILPLAQAKLSVREYVEWLQNRTLDFLKELGVDAFLKEEPGVFTAKGKIAFLGIRVDRGITRHGISINVNNDLNLFSGIRSCGSTGPVKMTSLKELGFHLSAQECFERWMKLPTTE